MRVLIYGAGLVGGWVGAHLAAAGWPVMMLGRASRLQAVREHGLTLTDLSGGRRHVQAAAFDLGERLSDLDLERQPPALTLLCVKAGATAEAAAELAHALPAGSPVLILQNGVGQADVARAAAPALLWLPGMVAYNISELGIAHLHRGTAGTLHAPQHPALVTWVERFNDAGLPLQQHADMQPVLWAKLLLNLNNPVNALSGLPLRAELLDRDLRHCFAALVEEALALMAGAGITPAQVTPMPMRRLPALLRLPTPVFRLLAARLLRIDPHARSSMADDLERGRRTEIDLLCGEVIRLAQRQGSSAPFNTRISALISSARAPQPHSGDELRRALGL
ncbi:MAG: hypothetical protein RIQ60_628 [Pseudomonadota bacterium]|jgi:2-dehydropantoate 2-reductase